MVPAVALLGEALEDVFPGETRVIGGAPLNVACHLRGFGAIQPLLVTRVGLDDGGERLMNFFQAHRLSAEGVQRDPVHVTGRVLVHAEGTRTRFEIPHPQAFDFLDAAEAQRALAAARPAAVYFGTLAQRHDTSRRAIRAAVDSARALRFCDLNLRKPWLCSEVIRESLGRTDVLKLNEEELRAVVARLDIPGANDPAGALMDAYPFRALVVTEGEKGAYRLDRSDGRRVERTRAAARPARRLVDTVGAGDGFAAVTLLGLVLGWEAEETLARANEFAGALCGIRGAVPAEDAFYEPFREKWQVAA